MKGARLTEREKAIIDTLAGKVPIDVIQALTGRPITTIRSRARAIHKSLEYFGKGGSAETGRKRNDLKTISQAKALLNRNMRPVDVMRVTGLSSGVVSRIRSGHIHKDVEPQLINKKDTNKSLLSEVFR
ncbi:hypothetical protein Ares1_0116 [Vibrio phage Ares1]|nr:hypothetical protein Ares1_0116 [Vibrio phage Ares1]